MKKPIIGITLDYEETEHYSKFPWYAIRYNYLHCLEQLGAIPFPLLHSQKLSKEILSSIDGLIITGGNFDIDPKNYGKKSKGARIIKNNRTLFEIKICKMLINSDKPILGICGGEQLINIACGGTLIQDIKKYNKNSIEHEQKTPRNKTSHQVNILENSKLNIILKKKKIDVNSAHHQSVDNIGKNLRISGIANDGIIESLEHINHKWCIGVQWHPEFLITDSDKKLIKSFIKAARR